MSTLSAFEFDVIIVNAEGQIIERHQTSAHYRVEQLATVSLEMIAVEGGTFQLGSSLTEEGAHQTQGPQHSVTVDSFLISKYPITQAQWKAVAAFPLVNQDLNPNPANFQGENRPVEQVSWYDAVEFCARLSQQTGVDYRLPSEAQWEYACRGSTLTPFHFGETITTDFS